MSDKQKKQFFLKHAKSSAALVSLGIHAVLVVLALSFVAVTVIQKEDRSFEAKPVSRPKMQLKKLQVPVNITKKKTQKPKLRKRLVVKNVQRKTPEFKMPEITGVKGGMAGAGDGTGRGLGIGFSMPELNFFGAKAKGEKVVFVVHFGPATIGKTPFTRTTGYTIRNRLKDLVDGLPEYTLFNVTAYFKGDNWAMSPKMLRATAGNKQMVADWMAPVNPLEGEYSHCFDIRKGSRIYREITAAYENYPTRVDQNMPFYSTKWAYPYDVPAETGEKYLGEGKNYNHWNRGVAWAVLTQKPDTIFVLTTNYIDPWGSRGGKGTPAPQKVMASYKKMFLDVYGPDKKRWPTINVVVLSRAGKDSKEAYKVLNTDFGPICKGTRGDGSVIEDITKFMNDEELSLYRKYQSEYANK